MSYAHIWVCVDCHAVVAATDTRPGDTHEGDKVHDTYCNPCGIAAGVYK
jgi:hypothetical protein